MKFVPLETQGAWLVEPEPRTDARGSFARLLDRELLAARGVEFTFVQQNLATNVQRGIVRGMHLQLPPAAEIKLVRCIRGAVWDVIVDVRIDSPTFLRHVGVELSAAGRQTLVVPHGFAHGYQTLTDDAELEYLVSAAYAPACERGLRPTDPRLAIGWPLPVSALSEKDASWPLLRVETGAAALPWTGGQDATVAAATAERAR